jgi:hypothetical protein
MQTPTTPERRRSVVPPPPPDAELTTLAWRIAASPGWTWSAGMALMCGRVVVAVDLDTSFRACEGVLLATRPDIAPPVTELLPKALALPDPRDEKVQDALTEQVAARHPDCQQHRRLLPRSGGGFLWQVLLICPSKGTVTFEADSLVEALLEVLQG